MSDQPVPPSIRDRLLASARRLLAFAERPDSPERCHICQFHPRGRMDGIPEFQRTFAEGNEFSYARCLVPVTCASCTAQSTIYVSALLQGDEVVSHPARELFAPDPDDPLLCRDWRAGRVYTPQKAPVTAETQREDADAVAH